MGVGRGEIRSKASSNARWIHDPLKSKVARDLVVSSEVELTLTPFNPFKTFI